LADPENTTITVFFFDADFDRASDLIVPGGIYSSFLFIRVFDIYMGTNPRRPIEFIFNDRPLNIPNIKSQSEGLAIVMFNGILFRSNDNTFDFLNNKYLTYHI